MAVSANQLIEAREADGILPVDVGASENLYHGTLVFIGSDGYGTGTAGSPNQFGGFMRNQSDNSSGADGDITGERYTRGAFTVPLGGAAQTDVGDKLYATDNYTFTKTSGTNPLIGTIVDFPKAGYVEVLIDVQAP